MHRIETKLATLTTLLLAAATAHAAPQGEASDAQVSPTQTTPTWYVGVGSGIDFEGRSVGELQTNPGAAQLGAIFGVELTPAWALELDVYNVFLPSGTVAQTGVDGTAAWTVLAFSYAPWYDARHRLFVATLGGVEMTATHVAETSRTQVDPLAGLRLGYTHRASGCLSLAFSTDLVPFWNTTVRTQGSVQFHF